MSKIRAVIDGVGAYLPEKRVTNDDLAQIMDTSDEWIRERSGIAARHYADKDELASDMAYAAATQAMARAQCTADDIELILIATLCPDLTFPSTAAILQERLGVKQGAAMDINAACSGFIYGLSIAQNFIATGQYRKVLLIGVEKLSILLDNDDRTTAVLFADGAGAAVLSAQEQTGSSDDRGVLSTYLRCDGSLKHLIRSDGGVGTTQTAGHVRMEGRETFKYAVKNISEAIMVALKEADLSIDDIDWFVPHQANKRILDGVAKKLKIPEDKVVVTIQEHGNTSAASVPLALNTAIEDGRVKEGDLVLFEAMGAGLTWGSALVRM